MRIRGDCMIADGEPGEKRGNALVSTEDGTEMKHEGNDQEGTSPDSTKN